MDFQSPCNNKKQQHMIVPKKGACTVLAMFVKSQDLGIQLAIIIYTCPHMQACMMLIWHISSKSHTIDHEHSHITPAFAYNFAPVAKANICSCTS